MVERNSKVRLQGRTQLNGRAKEVSLCSCGLDVAIGFCKRQGIASRWLLGEGKGLPPMVFGCMVSLPTSSYGAKGYSSC